MLALTITPARALLACLLIATAFSSAGCGEPTQLPERTIYISLATSGPLAQRGRDMADGARLALDQANYDTPDVRIALRVLDSRDNARNLRIAKADPRALAFIGNRDPEDFAARNSADAPRDSLLQIVLAPSTLDRPRGAVDPSKVIHLLPSAESSGRALAQAIAEQAPATIRLRGDFSTFARVAAQGFRDAMADAAAPAGDVHFVTDRRAVSSLVAVIPSGGGAKTFIADNPNGLNPRTDAQLVTPALAARDYPRSGKRFPKAFNDAYGRNPDRFAIYGYEAMGLALNAIVDAGKAGQPVTRSATSQAAFTIRDRFGPTGHYDVLPDGQTTLYTFGIRPWPLDIEAEKEASRAIEVDR
ncbi:MAG: hypothetical protein JJE27_02645 [Thermoleophilia bacterium]|nr:hypothetical protein [Thermoleophilia bacterium]